MLGSAISKQALLLHSPYAFVLLRFEIVRPDIQKNLDVFLFLGVLRNMENAKIIIPECLKGAKYLHPGYGPAFRKMLEQPEVMADFINSILHLDGKRKVVDLATAFEQPIDVFYPENKTFFFDAHVSTADRRYMDLELQRARHAFFVERTLIYNAYHVIHSKRIFEIAREKEKLKDNAVFRRRYELPELMSVWICNFTPRPDGPEHDDYRDYWAVYSGNDLKKKVALPVSEKIKYLIIDLPKFVKDHPAIDTRESFWLHLIALGVPAMPQTDDLIFSKAINNLLVVNASQDLLNRQAEMMTFNYSHEMDDIEAMLIDARNDGRELGHDDVFGVLRDVGVSANQIAEVQTRLAALKSQEANCK